MTQLMNLINICNDRNQLKVKIKSWMELKDKSWMADDMRIYCGRETEILDDAGNGFFWLRGCADWEWAEEGFEIIEEEEA